MTRDDVLKIIEQAAAEGWTKLDLSGKGLTEIPVEIAQITNLATLYLGYNQITEIPEAIAALGTANQATVQLNEFVNNASSLANKFQIELPITVPAQHQPLPNS